MKETQRNHHLGNVAQSAFGHCSSGRFEYNSSTASLPNFIRKSNCLVLYGASGVNRTELIQSTDVESIGKGADVS